MPPKKEKKDGKDKKPKGEKKKPPRSEMCECGVNEENEREPGWPKDDPRRGWVRVVAPAAGKGKKKKKKGAKEIINHNPGCTYQRAPCGKYPHLQKCPACAEGCPHCEKVIADCPMQASGACRRCMFMYKRDVLKSYTPAFPLGSLAQAFGAMTVGGGGPKKQSILPGLKKTNIMVG